MFPVSRGFSIKSYCCFDIPHIFDNASHQGSNSNILAKSHKSYLQNASCIYSLRSYILTCPSPAGTTWSPSALGLAKSSVLTANPTQRLKPFNLSQLQLRPEVLHQVALADSPPTKVPALIKGLLVPWSQPASNPQITGLHPQACSQAPVLGTAL